MTTMGSKACNSSEQKKRHRTSSKSSNYKVGRQDSSTTATTAVVPASTITTKAAHGVTAATTAAEKHCETQDQSNSKKPNCPNCSGAAAKNGYWSQGDIRLLRGYCNVTNTLRGKK